MACWGTEFVNKVKRNGIKVDYVSPNGGRVPLDPRSMKKPYASKKDKIPYSAEQEAKIRGANFLKTLPYTPNAIKCGRLITGQNPISGKAVARKLIKDLKKRELYL